MDFVQVDGNNVAAVAIAMRRVVENIRQGGPPAFVEAVTFRVRGHYEGDPQKYRDPELDALWLTRDPLLQAESLLQRGGLDATDIEAIRSEVQLEIDQAAEDASTGHAPIASTLFDYVSPVSADIAEPPIAPGHEPMRVSRAVRAALAYELEHDSRVFLAGIDVGAGGNVFGITRGLVEQFPGRVLDTPIAESAIVGLGIGAAMAGMRPVVEIMYSDFMAVCFDQIINQAAKLPFMTGGNVTLPLTIRTQFGAGRSSGAQHSQSLEAMLAHVPGLVVVMPSNAADSYGLLRAAIHHDGPVIVIEHRLLYEKSDPGFDETHIVPLGKAKILREGSQITIVSYSRMVRESLLAADRLAAEGIDAEVIDLRTIAPLDWTSVMTSLAKTSRLLVAHEAVSDFGVGAEIAARAVDEGFWNLDAPVVRVGAPFTPAPYAPSLEEAWVPGEEQIVTVARRVMSA
jgi:2-oxoisovalerate dehydrogenase E1 component